MRGGLPATSAALAAVSGGEPLVPPTAPPPAAFAPYAASFHTVSEVRVLAGLSASRVPPTAVTNGDTAG